MNRRFCPILKSAVLFHYQNRRFCPFSKSAILSHSKIGGFVSHPKIGCRAEGGSFFWPPQSLDLSPLDFLLWGTFWSLFMRSILWTLTSWRVLFLLHIRDLEVIWCESQLKVYQRASLYYQENCGHFEPPKKWIVDGIEKGQQYPLQSSKPHPFICFHCREIKVLKKIPCVNNQLKS